MEHNGIKTPSNKSFGLLFSAIFLISAIFLFISHNIDIYVCVCASISLLLFFISLFFSNILSPFNRAWMFLGVILNKIFSPLILGFIYLVIVIPVGIFMRIRGRDVLHRKIAKDKETYWIVRDVSTVSPDQFNNQF